MWLFANKDKNSVSWKKLSFANTTKTRPYVICLCWQFFTIVNFGHLTFSTAKNLLYICPKARYALFAKQWQNTDEMKVLPEHWKFAKYDKNYATHYSLDIHLWFSLILFARKFLEWWNKTLSILGKLFSIKRPITFHILFKLCTNFVISSFVKCLVGKKARLNKILRRMHNKKPLQYTMNMRYPLFVFHTSFVASSVFYCCLRIVCNTGNTLVMGRSFMN